MTNPSPTSPATTGRPPVSSSGRLLRLLVGLATCGTGIAMMIAADLGLDPWSVLHQGIAEQSGIPIGRVSIYVGIVVLGMWIPLRERPGLGTILNVVVIGLVIDAVLAVVDTPGTLAARMALMVTGPVLMGIGSGFYIGAALGPGPRDGLMTGIARRGWSVARVRTAIEVSVLVGGVLLGGTVGVGTVLFALTIGPLVGWSLARLAVAPRTRPSAHGLQRTSSSG